MSDYPFSSDLTGRLANDLFGAPDPLGAIGIDFKPTQALLMAAVCWPRFVRYRGLVLLGPHVSPTVDDWIKKLDGCAYRVEEMVNHTHLWDVFTSFAESDEAQYEALEELGKGLATMWAAAVLAQAPDVPMVVECRGEPDDYGPTIYCYRRNKDDLVS
jgi:hypothetical protein